MTSFNPFDQTGTVDTIKGGPVDLDVVTPTEPEESAEESAEESGEEAPEEVAPEEEAPAPEAEQQSETSYDPGDHSVAEVLAYVQANPQERDSIIALEKAGKNRKGVVSLEEEA